MSTKRIYAIFLRQVYLVRGTPTRFFQIFIWTTIDVTLWGFISRYFGAVSGIKFGLIPILLGAVLLWDFLIQVMQGVTMSFFEDVWSHNFLNVFASPLRISEYVGGLILAGIARSALALVVMLSLATFLFGLPILVYGASLALFLLLLFLCGITLGIIGITIVLRLGPSAEWFVWPIPAILVPFVGVFYPLSTLPQWMQYVGRVLPPSYVFDGVRTIVAGGTFPTSTLLWGTLLSLVYLFAAYGLFFRTYKNAVKSGLLSRYSAESVT